METPASLLVGKPLHILAIALVFVVAHLLLRRVCRASTRAPYRGLRLGALCGLGVGGPDANAGGRHQGRSSLDLATARAVFDLVHHPRAPLARIIECGTREGQSEDQHRACPSCVMWGGHVFDLTLNRP
jgi:hypothetical protein